MNILGLILVLALLAGLVDVFFTIQSNTIKVMINGTAPFAIVSFLRAKSFSTYFFRLLMSVESDSHRLELVGHNLASIVMNRLPTGDGLVDTRWPLAKITITASNPTRLHEAWEAVQGNRRIWSQNCPLFVGF